MILSDKRIQETYKVSGNDLGRYGVLILTKFDCLINELPFNQTNMDRSLLIAEPIGANFVVATAHFESLNSAAARASQMK